MTKHTTKTTSESTHPSEAAFRGRPTKPIRVQLSRKKGWRLPANTMVVARGPGRKWGNPFKIRGSAPSGADSAKLARSEATEKFWQWIASDPKGRQLAAEAKVELRGKNVACWCKLVEECHGDVWLKVANE
jgi:hypothetical protein